MNIELIGVPIYYGADKKGPEYGPDKLREKKIADILAACGHEVYDFGNLHVPAVDDRLKYECEGKCKYLSAILEVSNNLAHQVYSSLKNSNFPLIIGGDHSLALGSISGASKYHENLAVIWVDAHGDINTDGTSSSGNIHGMPLAALMGVGREDMINLYYKGNKIKPENVFILGARDLDPGEIELIREKNLNVFSMTEIIERGFQTVVCQVIDILKEKRIESVHLSFDIDFLDSVYVPGTGTPVSGGANVLEAKNLLRQLAETGLVKSMDFVELNVALDENDKTADLAIELLEHIFAHIR